MPRSYTQTEIPVNEEQIPTLERVKQSSTVGSSMGLTNGEGLTGLARASISMELHCKDKSFAEKSR